MLERYFKIEDAQTDSVLLFGARQTGKTTLIHTLFPEAKTYDLLKSDEFERLSRRPQLLREELLLAKENTLIIIDEIQKIPALLDEVHWLISNKNLRFLLSGSSARKLLCAGVNTLGGRALINKLYPLVSAEIPDFDLIRAVNFGLLPQHYLSKNAKKKLQAYVGIYLEEEIKKEALVRNLSSFSRFLEVAALTNGEIVNYTNIAQDCGVSANTVKEYFTILQDTLVGFFVPAFRKVAKRKLIQAPRFYFFDVGVANYLKNTLNIQPGSIDFGRSFEHFVIQELTAYIGYTDNDNKLSYWHTNSGVEVDVILGDAKVAIEIKSSSEVKQSQLKGLKIFREEYPESRCIMVSMDKNPRIMDEIEIFPIEHFLKELWLGKVI